MTKNRLKIAKYGNCTKKHNILVGKNFSRIKCLSVKKKSAEILVGKKFSHLAKNLVIFADFFLPIENMSFRKIMHLNKVNGKYDPFN